MKKALFSAAIVIASFVRHDAHACSCVGLHLAYFSPTSSDAPTNAHVRLIAPTQGLQTSQFVLRVHNGATIATTIKTYPESRITVVELVPTAALPASTRFEVATIDPSAHPPTTVIGTFATGTTADTTPPRIDSLGKQRTRLNLTFGGGDCSIPGPWIELVDFVAHDDRGATDFAFGVWSANAAGVIDTTRSPDALLFSYGHTLDIGTTNSCDPRRFSFAGSTASLAIAAFDEAGNQSRVVRIRADLTKNTP